MMLNHDKSATLEVADPKANKRVKKQGTLKMILRQLQSTGNPPLVGGHYQHGTGLHGRNAGALG